MGETDLSVQLRLSYRRIAATAAIFLPCVFLAAMAWQRRWTADDGFINFRIVEQILSGNGPVFNTGERVETGTSVMWLALLSVGDLLLPLRLEYVALLLSITASVAGVALATLGTRILADIAFGHRGVALPVGAAVFVAVPAAWDFSTSGLDSALGFAWIGLSWYLLVRIATRPATSQRALWATAVVIGLGVLVRPDFAIIVAIFVLGLIVIAGATSWRSAIPIVGAALALPVAYQVFRMGYYAMIVPNTAVAKEAGRSWWSQGWRYFDDFVGIYWLWIPVLALVAGCLAPLWRRCRRERRLLVLSAAPIVAGLVHALYWMRVGGDFMHGRMLLPSLMLILLPVFVARIDRAQWIAAIVVSSWFIVCVLALRVPYLGTIGPDGITDERGIYVRASKEANPVTLHDFRRVGWRVAGAASTRLADEGVSGIIVFPDLKPTSVVPFGPGQAPDARLVSRTDGMGLLAYESGLDVYVADTFGLADPLVAHRQLARRTGSPGHEKGLPFEWLYARFAPRSAAYPLGIRGRLVEDAATALACPRMQRFLDAINGELTPRRFLSNIVHSFEWTNLRYSKQPRRAAKELCL